MKMDNMNSKTKKPYRKKFIYLISTTIAVFMVFSLSVYAWFSISQAEIASYIPVASPQALYIGAGHAEIVNGTIEEYEDVRYLYISEVDVTEGLPYGDYLFCVCGRSVSSFKIQLAYTTNNQFSYEIYQATEYNTSPGFEYTDHLSSSGTYYYRRNNSPLNGTYKNKVMSGSEAIADSSSLSVTYDSYTYVDQYADPIYWVSEGISTGIRRGGFVKYFILRVYINGKTENDKETDIICISAQSGSGS